MAVARRTVRQVSTNPLPGVRRTAAETDLSAGVGLEHARAEKFERIGGTLSRVAGAAAGHLEDVIKEERAKANETAVLEASNKLEQRKRTRLYDPEKGALLLKGKDAQGLPEAVMGDLTKDADEIGATLTTPEQRAEFAKIRSSILSTSDLEVRRHVFGEMQTFRQNELIAAEQLGVDAAIRSAADPALVMVNLGKVEQQLRINLPRLGLGKEAVDARIAETRSKVHEGVIQQLLATEQDVKAKAYLKGNREFIAADRLDDLDKAVEEGSLRTAAQQESDRIIAAGGTLKEQLAEARKLEGKLRDAVEQRLDHNDTRVQREKREAEEGDLNAAYNAVTKSGGRLSAIPPDMWNRLGSHHPAITNYAKSMLEGVPIRTDGGTLYDLITLSSVDPETFAKTNLRGFIDRLSATDLEGLAKLQASIRTGKREDAAKMFVSEKNQNAIVDEALRGLGLVGTDAELAKPENKELGERIGRFRRAVREATTRHEQQTGKPATDADLQRIVDTMITPAGTRKTGPFSSVTTHIFETPQAHITEAALIPRTMKPQIDEALRRKGLPVDDRHRVMMFNEYVATTIRKDR